MNKKVRFWIGLLLIAGLISSLINGSGDVLCISENHVSFERPHEKSDDCQDKVVCSEVECDDDVKELEHEHCSTKKDCGDCVDIQMFDTYDKEEITLIQVPDLVFLICLDLKSLTYIKMPDLKKYRLNWDIPLNDSSPSHEFKLINTLLV